MRPLGLRNSLVKLFHREVMLQCKVEVREFLEPVQLGQSVAGAAKLVHAIGGALRADQELICCRIDLKKAFNECSKTAILEALQVEESLSHLTTFAATILSPDVALESGGERWGMAEDGVAQGDVPSGAFFCVAQQASLVKLDQDCQQGDGLARAGYDDVYAVGKPEVVLPAVIRFQQDLSNRCGLTMQWGKTEWFSWDKVLPPHSPPELKFFGMFSEENNGEFMRGFMCYGIPLGTERYVSHMLQQKAEEIAEDAIKTVQVLSGDRQALWSVLRLSTLTRFEYFCQLAPPSLCEPIACWLDGKLWSMLQAAVGFEIPRGEAGDKVACPVGELDGRSYQEWVVRLPIRLHGWGLRSLKETCGPAYFGALETAIPFMAARDKLCTQMETDWGGEECWGEAAEPSNRWRVVLESGCLEGRELQRWFQMLQSEATEAGPYLGEPPDPLLNSDLQGLGGSSVSGATRGLVVEARDMLRSRLLTKALQLHRPKKDRHAWAWKQRDKLSSAWLLSLPGGGETLTNEEFTTTAAVNLCLPPPCVAGREGELIRGQGLRQITIDKHGDTVQATNIPGDHFRQRHDLLKITMFNMCKWAGLKAKVEAYNVFSRLIPQRELARYEKNRQRQAIIPDLRIVFNVGGQSVAGLNECKVISISSSRYSPSWEERGVDRRASLVHGEYLTEARTVDRLYVGTLEG